MTALDKDYMLKLKNIKGHPSKQDLNDTVEKYNVDSAAFVLFQGWNTLSESYVENSKNALDDRQLRALSKIAFEYGNQKEEIEDIAVEIEVKHNNENTKYLAIVNVFPSEYTRPATSYTLLKLKTGQNPKKIVEEFERGSKYQYIGLKGRYTQLGTDPFESNLPEDKLYLVAIAFEVTHSLPENTELRFDEYSVKI